MRDFLRKKRKTTEEQPEQDVAVDTAGVRTPSETAPRIKRRRRWYLRFARQQLAGWSPILTGNMVVAYLFITAIVCFALGLPILLASTGLSQYHVRYDDVGSFASQTSQQRQQQLWSRGGVGLPLSVSINVGRRMPAPVYLYFHLGTYHQNHKRYVRSRKDKQLARHDNASSVCNPEAWLFDNKMDAGQPFQGDILPCGLIAWSQFNDSFSTTVTSPGASTANLPLDESLIAWTYDRDHFYSPRIPHNWNDAANVGHQIGGNTSTLPLKEQQHFMVWMRPSATPAVKKLYAVIHQDIPAGSVVNVTVQNRYNTYDFDGTKSVILSNESWVGGKNTFLGVAYLVIAGLSLLAGITFFVFYGLGLATRRKFADYSYLSWNRHG